MAAHLFKRYVWLLDLIDRTGGVDYDEISSKWEASALNKYQEPLPRRTLHNHIAAISDMFGIDIVCRRQGGYRYVIENSGDNSDSKMQQNLVSQLRIANVMMNHSKLQKRIVMDQYKQFRWFTPLITAMEQDKAVKVIYFDPNKDRMDAKRSTITIEPYFINQFDKYFLIGRAREDGLVHAFALQSIRRIDITDEIFSMPKDFDIQAYIADPPYYDTADCVDNDDATFLAERVYSVRRSRWSDDFSPQDGEVDYAKLDVTHDKIARNAHLTEKYQKRHLFGITLYETPYDDMGFVVFLQNYTPTTRPYIYAVMFDNCIEVKIALDNREIIDTNRRGRETPQGVAKLYSRVCDWLDESCQEKKFNGTNSEYALWLWNHFYAPSPMLLRLLQE
ncbi:MAG: WYL domain-containing protein [Alistipes sp.]|nr:WYL domain-containing protein [Alistipes sp.]